ncbi:hypothetical protein CDAR_601041 [Caerostris darwini]|uniref:CCHC-type domain-containing protein n=1 Tax=Caerostris darwini TaxID=1538125 RepID=A0AAV4VVA7_9ARAC|nr:hypothetical protein CDAR_601041 [Caerostris darwini]
MYEKECDFRPRQKFPLNEPTGNNKRTDQERFKNECFTTGSYNNKYCGYTQWRGPIQKDKRCFVCNDNTHFARDCPKQKFKFDRINGEQILNGEERELNEMEAAIYIKEITA